jgi:hypothetical protein
MGFLGTGPGPGGTDRSDGEKRIEVEAGTGTGRSDIRGVKEGSWRLRTGVGGERKTIGEGEELEEMERQHMRESQELQEGVAFFEGGDVKGIKRPTSRGDAECKESTDGDTEGCAGTEKAEGVAADTNRSGRKRDQQAEQKSCASPSNRAGTSHGFSCLTSARETSGNECRFPSA